MTPQPSDEAKDEVGFLDHLDELRKRIFRCLLAVLAGFMVCYPFADAIFAFLAAPIYRFLPEGSKLAYTKLSEPFMVLLKVSAIAGVFLAAPVVFYQIWKFVSPGLYRDEKRYALPFIIGATALFGSGGWFGFGVVFPYVCHFFLSVGEEFMMVVKMEEYFSLLAWSLIGMGVIFELPLLALVLARFGLVTPTFMWRNAHYAVFICFLAAALITPTPDAVTMTVVAVPMIVLYFMSIGIAWIAAPRASEEATEDSSSDPAATPPSDS